MSDTPGGVVTRLNSTEVNSSDPYPLFVIQAVIIIGLCYVLHLGLHKLKQPRDISEVIAGIILGPSVMGRILGFATTIFNPAGLPYLNLVSNLGLVSLGPLPDPPVSNTDDGEPPVLSRPLVTSNTQMVSRLLNATLSTGLATAVFVDREFGGSGHFLNIMVPLYGSQDDEEALKLASAMTHNQICNILIVRIEAFKKSLDEKDMEEAHLEIDCQSINSDVEALVLRDDES